MSILTYNFSVENIEVTEDYSALRAELAIINADVSREKYIFDPDKSPLARQKNLFLENKKEYVSDRYYYGIVLERRDSLKMPSLIEVFVDVPGLNKKVITHPDIFASNNIDLDFYEDLIFYQIDTYECRNMLPTQGGICIVQASQYYPNHREVDKFGNRFIGMITDIPVIKISKDKERLRFSNPKNLGYQAFGGGYASGSSPIVYSSAAGQGSPFLDTVGAPTSTTKKQVITIPYEKGKPLSLITYITPDKPNGKKVLLIGDSHVAHPAIFGSSLIDTLGKYGYTVVRIARGGAQIRSYYTNWTRLRRYNNTEKDDAVYGQEAYKKVLEESLPKINVDIAILNYGTNELVSNFDSGREKLGTQEVINNFLKIKEEIKANWFYWIMPPLFSESGARQIIEKGKITSWTAKGLELNAREELFEQYVDQASLQGNIKILKIKYLMQRPNYKAELDRASVNNVHFFGNMAANVGKISALYIMQGREIRQKSDVEEKYYSLGESLPYNIKDAKSLN